MRIDEVVIGSLVIIKDEKRNPSFVGHTGQIVEFMNSTMLRIKFSDKNLITAFYYPMECRAAKCSEHISRDKIEAELDRVWEKNHNRVCLCRNCQ